MKNKLLKIKSNRGAVDKVLVTLLLVIVGIASIIGLEQWNKGQKDLLMDKTNTSITDVINE